MRNDTAPVHFIKEHLCNKNDGSAIFQPVKDFVNGPTTELRDIKYTKG
jgi:hypothetical protein